MLISGAFPTDFAHSACVFRTVDSDSRRSSARRRMQRKNVMPKSKIRLRGSVFGLRFAKAFRGSPGGGRYCVSVFPTDESDRRSASARGIGRRMPCARSLSGYRGVRRNGYSLHVGTEMRRCAPRAYLMQSCDISAPVGQDRGQSEHIGTFLIGIRRRFAHFGTYLLETVRRFAYIDGLARDRMRILRVRTQEGSARGAFRGAK